MLTLRPRSDFIETPAIRALTRRALGYLKAGFPVHFRGPAGTGKTTLALDVAAKRGRPVMLITGDEEFGTSDLVGGQNGYRFRKVIDNYIQSVKKFEEDSVKLWVDHRLTCACREGLTLVYDEFTRSRAEANNALLMVLEEQLLVLPTDIDQGAYIKVHPDFRAIFTSNPQEYAGVHVVQDALSDRLMTINVDYPGRDTEVAIAAARSGLTGAEAARVVDLVRHFRDAGEYDQTPTLRACIMICRVMAMQGMQASARDPRFVELCMDVLQSKVVDPKQRGACSRSLMVLIEQHLGDIGFDLRQEDRGEDQGSSRDPDDARALDEDEDP